MTAPLRTAGNAPAAGCRGPAWLTALEAADAIRAGKLTSEELVGACAARIAETEDTIQAWAAHDPDHALEQARARHRTRREGLPLGPLHGIPVGIKDVFDTADMPTEHGSPLYAGHKPVRDSAAVAMLRQAGAVVIGKTVTTEFATYHPGKTTNPHDPGRTPGGSSSGSAAAVASGMVPLAIGTQTNGSVIRPASFCGVVGFKPTFGSISRHGALLLSRPLDHVGVFARTVEDAALLADQLMSYDARDPDMRPQARPALLETALAEPPLTPRLGFVKSPVWDKAADDTRQAFQELTEVLGGDVEEVALPGPFDDAIATHTTLMHADLAKSLAREHERGADRLSAGLRAMIEDGRTVLAVDYNRALERREALDALLAPVFDEFDAILTPAAPGEAPLGLELTGSPIFCTIWTLCGTPAIALPLFEGSNGMPIGAQLVGKRGNDGRLLRTARWLLDRIAE